MDDAVAELEGLSASFPTQLDPPNFCDDPSFPVSGSVTVELQDGPTIQLTFTLRDGYGEEAAAENTASVRLCCDRFSRHDVDSLNEWASSRIAEHEGGGMEIMSIAMSLNDAVEDLGIEVQQEEPPAAESEVVPAVYVEFRMSEEDLERHKDHSAMREKQCDRQWVTFAMFVSTKLAKELQDIAFSTGLTGFLALGKPAVACLEGGPKAILEALERVRKEVFSKVPEKSARKMNLPMMEQACTRVRFEGFALITSADHKTTVPSLRGITDITGTTTSKRCKRHDVAPCGCDPWDFRLFTSLQEFLISRGIVEKTIKDVCSNKVQ